MKSIGFTLLMGHSSVDEKFSDEGTMGGKGAFGV